MEKLLEYKEQDPELSDIKLSILSEQPIESKTYPYRKMDVKYKVFDFGC